MISLRGASLHNLKNVDADFPKNSITVICGPSGCGKSSLAFDTLHGESKRRYLESLNPFVLKLLGGKKFIPLQSATGLIPSIALGPSRGEASLKETALSLGALDQAFHSLWAYFATPVCPICKKPATFQSREEIIEAIASLPEKSRIQCIAKVPTQNKTLGELSALYLQQGFSRVLADNTPFSLADLTKAEEKIIPEKFEIVVDRIIIRENTRTRISEAVDACFKITRHTIEIDEEGKRTVYSSLPVCKDGHTQEPLPILEAKAFSRYTHYSTCSYCQGNGVIENSTTCPVCNGFGLASFLLDSVFNGVSYKEAISLSFNEFRNLCLDIFNTNVPAFLHRTQNILQERLNAILELGLGYLSPCRNGESLSGGELERLRLVAATTGYLDGMLFCLDEPAAGLSSEDAIRLFKILEKIKARGNTLVLMEHHPEIISRADWIIEMGPRAGLQGGEILFQGAREEILARKDSPTGNWLRRLSEAKASDNLAQTGPTLDVVEFSKFGILPVCAKFPLAHFSVINGPSGSGKSTLLFEHLVPEFEKGNYSHLGLKKLNLLTTGSFHGNRKSTIASAIQIFTPLRELFASLPESKLRGYQAGKFATHAPGGRCETCKGEGIIYSPDGYEETECPVCLGKRFRDEVLEIRFKSLSIADILNLTVDEAVHLFEAFPKFFPKLKTLSETGLGYLHLGQTTQQLSGGERARLRLSIALEKKSNEPTLYLFDEPARGLHEVDIQKLLDLFSALCAQGHTIIAIEHSKDFEIRADYVLTLKNHSSQ